MVQVCLAWNQPLFIMAEHDQPVFVWDGNLGLITIYLDDELTS